MVKIGEAMSVKIKEAEKDVPSVSVVSANPIDSGSNPEHDVDMYSPSETSKTIDDLIERTQSLIIDIYGNGHEIVDEWEERRHDIIDKQFLAEKIAEFEKYEAERLYNLRETKEHFHNPQELLKIISYSGSIEMLRLIMDDFKRIIKGSLGLKGSSVHNPLKKELLGDEK